MVGDSMEQAIRFCRTEDGINIAYATVGQGPPLVKAANWLSHLEFDWNSPVWRHWLTTLSSHHQLIRYDERGCGLSDWDVDDFSLEAWVADLEAVIEEVGTGRFPLLGISRGSAIAIAYAARHPERVSHLILYGGYGRGWRYRELEPAQREEFTVMHDLIRLGWGKSNPAFRQVFTSLFIPEATTEQMQWFNDLQRVSTSPENAIRMRQASGETNVLGLVKKLKAPCLILHARRDAVVPLAEGRLLATLIPGARFVTLESANHILLESEPAWPHFLNEVYNFLGIEWDSTAAAEPSERGVAQPTRTMPAEMASLTLRERELLELMARGYRNAEIARSLVLSPKTVRNYISIVFSKLGVSSRGEAIVRARQAGFGRSDA